MKKKFTKTEIENVIKLMKLLRKIDKEMKDPNFERPPEGCILGRNGEIIHL